jgi:hypothetical protein
MKLTRFLALAAFALAAFALPVLAHAHPGHDGHELTWDFTSGASHPLLGWDHLIAMVAVGLWAAQLGGRSRWLLPVAFVGVMALGAAAGHAGQTVPGLPPPAWPLWVASPSFTGWPTGPKCRPRRADSRMDSVLPPPRPYCMPSAWDWARR